MKKKIASIYHSLQVWHIGLIILIIALFCIIQDKDSFFANIGTELLSISITILIVDQISKKNNENTEKNTLIYQLSSPENLIANEAARILRLKKILELHSISLYKANLENASLYEMDFTSSDFTYANLKSANLSGSIMKKVIFNETNLEDAIMHRAQLQNAEFFSETRNNYLLRNADLYFADLSGATFKGITSGDFSENEQDLQLHLTKKMCCAIMPNGKLYDGRYNLSGDRELARMNGYKEDDHEAMAKFYNVSINEYLAGQEWYSTFDYRFRFV